MTQDEIDRLKAQSQEKYEVLEAAIRNIPPNLDDAAQMDAYYATRAEAQREFDAAQYDLSAAYVLFDAERQPAANPGGQGTLGEDFATNTQMGMATGGTTGEITQFDVPAQEPVPERGQPAFIEGMGNSETLTPQEEIERNTGRAAEPRGSIDMAQGTLDDFWAEADSMSAEEQADFADYLKDNAISVDAPIRKLRQAMSDWEASRAPADAPTNPAGETEILTDASGMPEGSRFRTIPFEMLELREDLFQRRFPRGLAGGRYTKEEYVRNIADNWDLNRLDPWKVAWNPDTQKFVIIGGHHRYDAGALRISRNQLIGNGNNDIPVHILEGDIKTSAGRAKLVTDSIVDNHSRQDVPLSTTINDFNYLIEGPDPAIRTAGQAGAAMNLNQKEIDELQSLRQLNSAVLFELEQDDSLKPYAIELGKRVNTGMFTPLEAAAYWRNKISVAEKRPTLTSLRAELRAIQNAITNEQIKASDMFTGFDEGSFDAAEVKFSDATKALMLKQQRLDEIKTARAEFRGYAQNAAKIAEAFQQDQIDLPIAQIESNVEQYLKALDQHQERIEEGNLTDPLPTRSPIVSAIAANGEALGDKDGDGQIDAVDWDDDNDLVPDSHDITPAARKEETGMATNATGDMGEEAEVAKPLPGQTGMFGGAVGDDGTLRGDELDEQPETPPAPKPSSIDEATPETEPDYERDFNELFGGMGRDIKEGYRDALKKKRMEVFIRKGTPLDPEGIVRQYGDEAEVMRVLTDPGDAFGMTPDEAQEVINASKGNASSDYRFMLQQWAQRALAKRRRFIESRGEQSASEQTQPKADARAQRQAARAWGGSPPASEFGTEGLPSMNNPSPASPAPTESQAGGWYRQRDAYGRFAPGGTSPAPRVRQSATQGADMTAGAESDLPQTDAAPRTNTTAQTGTGGGQTQNVDVDVIVADGEKGNKHFQRREFTDQDGDKAAIITDDKGRTRAVGIDIDGDGAVDSYALDTKGDGKLDKIMVTDGRGKAEMVADFKLSGNRGSGFNLDVSDDVAMMRGSPNTLAKPKSGGRKRSNNSRPSMARNSKRKGKCAARGRQYSAMMR